MQEIPLTQGADDSARAWKAVDWLARVHTPAWLRLAGLTRHAEALASLTPIADATTARLAQPALDEARDAAWAGAWDAAGAAAGAAAWDAARDAARAAVGAAVGAAFRPTVAAPQASALELLILTLADAERLLSLWTKPTREVSE